MTTVRLEKITKYFGTFKALDEVSFEFSSGEIVAFLGPNGAGKSTTMKIICGYTLPTQGAVFMDQEKMDETNHVRMKRKVGYLPENNPLYGDLYVREYLYFVAGACGIAKKQATPILQQWIERLELNDQLKKKIGTLSKGYKQRVGLVAALVSDPQILILDEPTSGLDPNQAQTFRCILEELAKEKAILLSSHLLSEVEAVANRCILIHKGKMMADDRMAHLKSQGKKLDEMFRHLTAT